MSPIPLISVITACYNGADFLEMCVQSALANHPAAEVIVIDDGSADDSLARAAALARQFPDRVLAVSQANLGPAGARNTGIRLARGKYLCFLDVDDQYVPGFLHAAVDVLERDPSSVGVFCQIELVNAHRPVEIWQREAMEMSGPCNIVMRTEIVRQIGGFPVDPAFRGEAGGEDARFRKALLQFGKVLKLEHPFFRYRMRAGGYIDLFLDRASLVDGHVQIKYLTREEQDGSIHEATNRYQREVTSRALGRLIEKLIASVAAVANFHAHSAPLTGIPGILDPIECHALHWLAGKWPIDGGIVSVGGSDVRGLISLAAGSRDAGRGGITAVGIADASVSVIAALLEKAGISNSVQILSGNAAQIAATWEGRVRILFISADLPAAEITANLAAWFPRQTRFGLVVFQSASRSEVAALLNNLRNDTKAWKELLHVGDLIAIQKL